jgi:hypothetical protein
MKKLLLSAAAFGLLSGAALAEPQKLDDSILGDVAAGFLTLETSEVTNTLTSFADNSVSTRETNQTLSAISGNTVYATGLASDGVSAIGTSAATVTAPSLSMP